MDLNGMILKNLDSGTWLLSSSPSALTTKSLWFITVCQCLAEQLLLEWKASEGRQTVEVFQVNDYSITAFWFSAIKLEYCLRVYTQNLLNSLNQNLNYPFKTKNLIVAALIIPCYSDISPWRQQAPVSPNALSFTTEIERRVISSLWIKLSFPHSLQDSKGRLTRLLTVIPQRENNSWQLMTQLCKSSPIAVCLLLVPSIH